MAEQIGKLVQLAIAVGVAGLFDVAFMVFMKTRKLPRNKFKLYTGLGHILTVVLLAAWWGYIILGPV
jgi:hypothetical protein